MINIRAASPSESKAIAEFQVKMAKETEDHDLDPETVKRGVKAVFADSCKGSYYVAVNENQVIASMLITREWSDWRDGWVLWFQSVYVLAEYRRSGIFKSMYLFIQDLVKKSPDLKGLRLYVDQTNLTANQVYQALGMTDEHYRMFEWMKS